MCSSSEAGMASACGLDALPTDCLAHILGHLPLRDALTCQCASKRFALAAALPVAWERRLEKVYDLRLQTTGRGAVDWPALYRSIVRDSPPDAVRFRALFTDGGTDEGMMQYWADNMFVPNHWESYCSGLGANVHVVGILLGGRLPVDEQEEAHRAYMVERLRIPAQVIFDSGAGGFMAHRSRVRVEAWSTSELEHFLLMLQQQLEMGMGLGRLLLAGVKQADVPAALRKLHEVCANMAARHEHRAERMVTPPEQPHAVLDASLLPLLQAPPPGAANHVATIDRLAVSRAGHFSCPLRTGLLLLGNWHTALGARPDGSVCADAQSLLGRMQGVAADGACKAFDNITGREGLATLEAAAAAGELPRVIAWGTTPAGEWFEFQQGWRPPSGNGGLRPVAWIRFFDRAESAVVANKLDGSRGRMHAFDEPLSYANLPVPLAAAPDASPDALPCAFAWQLPSAADCAAARAAAGDADADVDESLAAGPEAEAAEAAAAAGEAGDAQEAADAAEAAELLGVAVAPGAGGIAAVEDAMMEPQPDDGFELEAFQDPQLVPLDELAGSDSEADEDMFVGEPDAAGGEEGGAGAAGAGNGAAARNANRSTDGRNMLDIQLVRRHAGSLALVKLIDSEDMMTAWHDDHEQPNIDVGCVALRGRRVVLPDTVRFAG